MELMQVMVTELREAYQPIEVPAVPVLISVEKRGFTLCCKRLKQFPARLQSPVITPFITGDDLAE